MCSYDQPACRYADSLMSTTCSIWISLCLFSRTVSPLAIFQTHTHTRTHAQLISLTSGNTACGFILLVKNIPLWHDNLTPMFISFPFKYAQILISNVKCTIKNMVNWEKMPVWFLNQKTEAELTLELCKKHDTSDKSRNLPWNKRQ